MGLLDYAANKYPHIPRHLSVQGSATSHEALSFYKDNFDIRRAVLPRVLSLDQVRGVAKHSPVELEVFADRKSTRLNSSHVRSSYAVFCLKKKNIDRRLAAV